MNKTQYLYQVGSTDEIKAMVDRMVLRGLAKRARPLNAKEQQAIKEAMKNMKDDE